MQCSPMFNYEYASDQLKAVLDSVAPLLLSVLLQSFAMKVIYVLCSQGVAALPDAERPEALCPCGASGNFMWGGSATARGACCRHTAT